MKKGIALILAALMMTASLAACGGSGTNSTTAANGGEESTGKLQQIKDAGVITVATSPDFPPFESLEGSDIDSIYGIEVDIIAKVAEELGVEAQFIAADFDSILAGVQSDKYDLGVSGFSVTDERKENALFTNAYCLAAQAIVVVEGSDITSKADLEGKAISVQTGTTAEEYTMSEGYNVMAFQANNDAETALIQGKVDAWVIDDLTAAAMVAEYNAQGDVQLVILDEAMTTEPYAFAMKLGNDDLAEAINEVLDTMLADGSIAALFDKYDAPYTAPEN